jgi:hypothetical protein
VRRAVFDEPNLLAAAGLVPVVALADRVCLQELVDQFLTVPTDKGANAGLKVASLVAGMVAGADSIDDIAILRHGGMRRAFDACYAPSTLGSSKGTSRPAGRPRSAHSRSPTRPHQQQDQLTK